MWEEKCGPYQKIVDLCFGYTQHTHGYLFDTKIKPKCNNCNQELTIKHIFVECNPLIEKRQAECLHPQSGLLPIPHIVFRT